MGGAALDVVGLGGAGRDRAGLEGVGLTADLALLFRFGFGGSTLSMSSVAVTRATSGLGTSGGETRGTLFWNIHVSTDVRNENNELTDAGNGFSLMRSPNVKPKPILRSLGGGVEGLTDGTFSTSDVRS